MTEPLAIDLFSGLGGWAEGAEAEGFHVRRYDLFDMFTETGTPKPEGLDLVLRDVLTIHGAELADADLILASPPCQFFSYTAMPWSLAKERAARTRADPELLAKELALFNACFRIQREACEAAGRHIPMVIENVNGAQPWVGRARWSFGSFFLWGDVPALMPIQKYHSRLKVREGEQLNVNRPNFTGARGWDDEGVKNPGFRFDGSGKSFQTESVNRHVAPDEGFKSKGMNWSNRNLRGQDFTAIAGAQSAAAEGIKNRDSDGYERNHPNAFGWEIPRTTSKGAARKAASAKIAKIPEALSRHIAKVYHPRNGGAS